MNLQRRDENRDYWLPCAHKRARVQPTVGTIRLPRCPICRTRYVAEVTAPPSGRTDRVAVTLREEVNA